MVDLDHFVSVKFHRFKAFRNFSLSLGHFNILVGPNNAGKSTILTAFRILSAAMRKAAKRNAELIKGPQGRTFGHRIDLATLSVAEENVFYNYDDSEPASVTFTLSNANRLILHFTEPGSCAMILDAGGREVRGTQSFKSNFNCPIGFVPILGPVEHREPLYEKTAARLALYNYRAARNFRNIWHHFPERFDDFRLALIQTWPGMDIQRPELMRGDGKPLLHMFCPEDRIPREIFWAGFGFQVWCQMLTHLIQSAHVSLFLIDEPDIYLHSDLQRQLVARLRNLGPVT
jgi:energy-coupling factor transporter ATP-binding protein EcfA2